MNMFFIQTQSIVPFYKRLATRSIFPVFLSDNIGLNITSDKNIFFFPLATTNFSEITHPFPSKIRRLATTQGRRDWKPYPSAILSFSCTERRSPIFDWALPKGQPNKSEQECISRVLSGLQTLGFASSF